MRESITWKTKRINVKKLREISDKTDATTINHHHHHKHPHHRQHHCYHHRHPAAAGAAAGAAAAAAAAERPKDNIDNICFSVLNMHQWGGTGIEMEIYFPYNLEGPS